MKTLKDTIQKAFYQTSVNEFDNYVVEGLNINPITKTVSLTDDHSKGVDFSLVNNPVYSSYSGYDVISIFKRTLLYDIDNVQRDGNPFIYALKNKYGWKFDVTNEDIYKYIKRFLQICQKINSSYDTIIITPSSSDLNERFMTSIAKQVKAKNVINEFFLKMTIEEIVDDDLIDVEQIQKDHTSDYNKVLGDIHRSFRRMKNGTFEAKLIKKEYLKYIKYIGTSDNKHLRELIDDKDILLLDDTISSGETISQCIDGILSNFVPKSITIITLLSELKNH